jgi:hypothetical protein
LDGISFSMFGIFEIGKDIQFAFTSASLPAAKRD